MKQPKIGMHFEDARTRTKRICKNVPKSERKDRLVKSMLNQVKLAEGSKAANELHKELTSR